MPKLLTNFALMKNKVEPSQTYTEAMLRLEKIVSTIEHQSPDVDELTKLVAEAIELVKYCREKLTKADKQLEDLMAKLN